MAAFFDRYMDLYSPVDIIIPVNGRITLDTGVRLEIPERWVGLIRSRSGMMVNHGITTDGTIDSHYTGSIRVCLFNYSDSEYRVNELNAIIEFLMDWEHKYDKVIAEINPTFTYYRPESPIAAIVQRITELENDILKRLENK